jgi:hypothetical protein
VWVTATLGWSVTIVKKQRRWVRVGERQSPPYLIGFQVLPQR